MAQATRVPSLASSEQQVSTTNASQRAAMLKAGAIYDQEAGEKSGASSKTKPSYKHIPHSQKPPHLVAKRNARERRRVQAVNKAFFVLRKRVPIENRNKRVSKVKTLQRAIEYIKRLERILAEDDEQNGGDGGASSAAQSSAPRRPIFVSSRAGDEAELRLLMSPEPRTGASGKRVAKAKKQTQEISTTTLDDAQQPATKSRRGRKPNSSKLQSASAESQLMTPTTTTPAQSSLEQDSPSAPLLPPYSCLVAPNFAATNGHHQQLHSQQSTNYSNYPHHHHYSAYTLDQRPTSVSTPPPYASHTQHYQHSYPPSLMQADNDNYGQMYEQNSYASSYDHYYGQQQQQATTHEHQVPYGLTTGCSGDAVAADSTMLTPQVHSSNAWLRAQKQALNSTSSSSSSFASSSPSSSSANLSGQSTGSAVGFGAHATSGRSLPSGRPAQPASGATTAAALTTTAAAADSTSSAALGSPYSSSSSSFGSCAPLKSLDLSGGPTAPLQSKAKGTERAPPTRDERLHGRPQQVNNNNYQHQRHHLSLGQQPPGDGSGQQPPPKCGGDGYLHAMAAGPRQPQQRNYADDRHSYQPSLDSYRQQSFVFCNAMAEQQHGGAAREPQSSYGGGGGRSVDSILPS